MIKFGFTIINSHIAAYGKIIEESESGIAFPNAILMYDTNWLFISSYVSTVILPSLLNLIMLIFTIVKIIILLSKTHSFIG